MRSIRTRRLIALGAANVAAGLFQGFSISSSSSRTPVAESAGAKTQLTGVVGALCIALLLVFAPTLLQNLPNAALGAVVIAACLSLVDVKGVVRLYHLRRGEFVLSIVCFLGVALIGVIQGIFIAVGAGLARLHLARVAALRCRAGPRRWAERLSRHHALS